MKKDRLPRIAVVGRYYNEQGGVSNVMAQLLRRAVETGRYDMTLYSHEVLDLEHRPEGLAVQLVPMLERPSWAQVATFGRRVRRMIDQADFDLVHAHDPQMAGANLYTAHSCFAEYIGQRRCHAGPAVRAASAVHPRHRIGLWNERRAYGTDGNTIVAVSGSVAEQIDQRYVRTQPTGHIYNGVDLERFSRLDRADGRRWLEERIRKRLAERFTMLFVGYEFERKRLRVAIESLRSIPTAELVVAGKGPIEEFRSIARATGVGDRVHFLGHVSNIEFAMRGSDAFIFPTRYEAASLAILEALAAGLPIVTTDIAMAHEVLNDGETALLLPNSDDPGPATAALSKLADSTHLRNHLARNGKDLVAQYSWDAIWKRYDALYERLLAERAAG